MGLMDNRRRILADAPVLAEASGAVASFQTDMAVPLKQCQFSIEPVQSGTGDPSPSNVRPISGWTGANISRTGVNIWDEQWETGSISETTGEKTSNNNYWRSKNLIPIKAGETYFVYNNLFGDTTYFRVYYYDASKTFFYWESTRVNRTFTVPDNACYMMFRWSNTHTEGELMSFNYPSTDTAYHAYTGNTYPVQFPATKNLWNGTLTNNGYIEFPVISGQAYTVTAKRIDTTVSTYLYLEKRATGSTDTWETVGKPIQNAVENVVTFTAEAGYDYALWSNASYSNVKEVQIENGSTATAYEPYGTIYGGYIDPVRGVAVAEWVKLILNGSEPDEWFGGYSASYGGITLLTDRTGYEAGVDATNPSTQMMSDKFKALASRGSGTISSDYVLKTYASKSDTKWIFFCGDFGVATPTVSDFKTWLTSNNTEICYELKTPIEYPLTPQLIKSLKGQNNVFSDLNGNTTVQYWKH